MSSSFSMKHAQGHIDRTVRAALEKDREREIDKQFWDREAKRPPDQPRDACRRCGVAGIVHHEHGCRRYVAATPGFVPRASFHHNNNGGV